MAKTREELKSDLGRPPMADKYRQTIVCEYREKQRIEKIAMRLGYLHAGHGSFGKLVRGIGRGELLVGYRSGLKTPTEEEAEALSSILKLVPGELGYVAEIAEIVKMLASGELRLIKTRR